MFSVVIAENNIIDLFDKYKSFLGPLKESDNIAFCTWNREGNTLTEMLPELYDIIAFKKEWRAVILNDDGIYQKNPFDFTGYSEPRENTRKLAFDSIAKRRNDRLQCYEKATENPLVKLSTALCGIPVFLTSIEDVGVYDSIVSGETDLRFFMLIRYMNSVNLSAVATDLRMYDKKKLTRFVAEDNIERLISCVENNDAKEIFDMLHKEDIVRFIGFLSHNDPEFTDLEYAECMVENTRKIQLYNELAKTFLLKDKLPAEVICLSPRIYDFNYDPIDDGRFEDETNYSNFAEFNLYHEKLRYLVFDMAPKDNRLYAVDEVKLLCLLLVLAQNKSPNGVLSKNRLYRAHMDFDENAVRDYCNEYLCKLSATVVRINEIELNLDYMDNAELSNRDSRYLFEKEVTVPVKINQESSRSELMAEYSSIGLAKDCPQDEEICWKAQYHSINKALVRYLREPRRAVKTAVGHEFRSKSKIEDDRILKLNEFQREDIEYKLIEEERNMIETSTTNLFNIKEYTKKLDAADAELKDRISKRMTRNMALIAGGVGVFFYLFSFIPLIISDYNNTGSFSFSLLLTGVCVGLFVGVGLACLFLLRHQLIRLFKKFNAIMNSICSDIDEGLKQFSKYLSHACNMMREYSVLQFKKSQREKDKAILKMHRIVIDKRFKEFAETFSAFIDPKAINSKDVDPFDFDFLVDREYVYDVEHVFNPTTIEYMQSGNDIKIPVDFIKSVYVRREELYD